MSTETKPDEVSRASDCSPDSKDVRRQWRVEIERKQYDVVAVEADNFDEAILKGQRSLFQVRIRETVTATATVKTPPGERPVESMYD